VSWLELHNGKVYWKSLYCAGCNLITISAKMVLGSCNCSNEPLGFIKCGEFLE
jgi:hypothetical protein